MDTQRKRKTVKLLMEYRAGIAAELESLDQAIRAMTGDETTFESRIPEVPSPATNKDNWTKMTVQRAVLRALELHPNKTYRASEIRRYLKKRKFPRSDQKSFAASVATSVRRLAAKKMAIKTTVDVNGRTVAAFKYKNTDS